MNSSESMGRGPYRNRMMTELSEAELMWLAQTAQAQLDAMRNGTGDCEYARYKNVSWAEIRQFDTKYWRWASEDYAETVHIANTLLAQIENQRRREREEREHLAAAQLSAGEPLFNPAEQHEIKTNNLLEMVEQCFTAGRRQLVKANHTDVGGSKDFMIRLNLCEAVFAKIMAALKQEQQDSENQTVSKKQ